MAVYCSKCGNKLGFKLVKGGIIGPTHRRCSKCGCLEPTGAMPFGKLSATKKNLVVLFALIAIGGLSYMSATGKYNSQSHFVVPQIVTKEVPFLYFFRIQLIVHTLLIGLPLLIISLIARSKQDNIDFYLKTQDKEHEESDSEIREYIQKLEQQKSRGGTKEEK